MSSSSGPSALAHGAILSPFTELRRLLDGIEPGHKEPIDLTVGEPGEAMPPFIAEKIAEAAAGFAKYPPIRGTQELRGAISEWIARRYGPEAAIDPSREVLPLNGSREGLFYAAIPAVGRKRAKGRQAILLCNPYYGAYLGAALAVDSEPVFLNATEATGHLPDVDEIATDKALLDRTAAFYLCSPANPQGVVASPAYLDRALELARVHDFMLFVDECYSEIYSADPPPGALQVAAATSARFRNLVVFNSLSKRSNLPGLRSGFCAGDPRFLETFAEIRNLVAPQMPGPIQHVSAAVWREEAHVLANRQAYREKYDVCDIHLGGRYGHRRPAGGFFLWLDVINFGGSGEAAVTLWKYCGVKVLPGAFLAQAGRDGINPGANYIRLALVHDVAIVGKALERFVAVLA